jgi:hypothetical protein
MRKIGKCTQCGNDFIDRSKHGKKTICRLCKKENKKNRPKVSQKQLHDLKWKRIYEKRKKLKELRKSLKQDAVEQRKRESIRHNSLWQPVRDAAIERDKGCIRCGSVEKMNAHHIHNFNDYPNERYDLNNVVIFCEKCHIKFHQKYGKLLNERSQIEEFIQNS